MSDQHLMKLRETLVAVSQQRTQAKLPILSHFSVEVVQVERFEKHISRSTLHKPVHIPLHAVTSHAEDRYIHLQVA